MVHIEIQIKDHIQPVIQLYLYYYCNPSLSAGHQILTISRLVRLLALFA